MSAPTTPAPLPSAAAPAARAPGWLRGPGFDGALILGTLNLALVAGLLVAGLPQPRLFALVLTLDLWLLGYHHVAATFTRLACDRESLRQHWFLLVGVPPLIVAWVVAVGWTLGAWGIATAYFHWQWLHYTRQSYGVERMYARRAGAGGAPDRWSWAVIYGVPLFGLLWRSHEAQPRFLGAPVGYLPVPAWALWLAGAAAAVALAGWLVQRARDARRGELRRAHALYVLSHVFVFAFAYVVLGDVTHGWLVVNVWHNAQYVLVVWLFNVNRFKAGPDPRARALSTLSQPRRVVAYFAACILASTAFYLTLGAAAEGTFLFAGVPTALVLFQVVNFHHYVVDGVIWKLRAPRVRAHLVG